MTLSRLASRLLLFPAVGYFKIGLPYSMPNPSASGEETQFDNLCAMCVPLFDGSINPGKEFIWDPENMQPFHDISSLTKSADSCCHICNLLLSQIEPKDVAQLRRDLDASAVTSSQQLKVDVVGKSILCLDLWAKSVSLQDSSKYYLRRNGYFEIGKLLIRSVEDDYTNAIRSTGHWNCSESTIAQISRWLGQCITSHKRCFDAQIIAATRDVLPTRLLDLRPVTQENCLKLVGTTVLPKDTLYATLSHCWGGRCDATLTVENLHFFEKGLPLNSIPKTFQDAVSVTIRLGVRYLWIDALCIVQNSKEDFDWKQEASIMGDVYANSYFTLAATVSIDSRGGLLQQRSPLAAWPCRLMADWYYGGPRQVIVSNFGLGPEMDNLPLGTRAWAFQEWLLSKRLVHFSKHEVRWECYCVAASEVYPTGLDKSNYLEDQGLPTKNIIAIMQDKSESAQHLWGRIREEYSGKALTKTSDKLAAFSGIARMAFKVLKSPSNDYLAGMWKPHLLTELLWERSEDEEAHYEPDLYTAPTWSWASLNGGILDLGAQFSRSEGQSYGEVLDVHVTPVDDVFGPVKAGSLTLRTWICQFEIRSPKERTSRTITLEKGWKLSAINGIEASHSNMISIDHPSLKMRRLSVLLSFHFIPIRSDFNRDKSRRRDLAGLLLRRTGKKRGQYYRVGVFRLFIRDDKEDKALLQLEEQDNIEPASYLDYPLPGVKAVEIV